MGREVTPRSIPVSKMVVPLEHGGTGANVAPDAVTNLNLVTTAQKDQVNGVFALNAQGKIPGSKFPNTGALNKVNMNGSLTVYTSQVVQFTITDYDSFRAFTVSVDSGTVSRSGDTITYTAPGTAGTANLTINGRVIAITIALPAPATPSITSPVNGTTNVVNNPSFTSSAFTPLGDSSTHASSDWQIASDAGFTTIVSQSINDATNKTSWTSSTTLANLTTYYARVRYKSTNGNSSAYSAAVSFTTRAFAAATSEEAKIVASNKSTNALFGFYVDIAADGSRVVANALNVGGFYVFVRSGSTWSQETFVSGSVWCSTIDATGTRVAVGNASGAISIYRRSVSTWSLEQSINAGGQFGICIDFDQDATRVIAGSNTGAFVNVYSRSGVTWTLEQALTDATISQFGCFACMSSDGTRVAATGYNGVGAGSPKVDVFVRSGVTWTQEQQIGPTTASTNMDYFGACMALDSTGTRLLCSAKYNTTAAGITEAGCAYVFKRTGSAWAQEAVLKADNPAASNYFSSGADINANGDVIACGSCSSGAGNITTLYIFTRTGTTWTLGNKLRPSDTVAGDNNQFALNYPYRPVGMASNNSRIVYSAEYQDPGGTVDAGSAYIFV